MKVMAVDRFHVKGEAVLRKDKRIEFTRPNKNAAPTKEELQSVEILIVRSKTKVNSDFLKNAPNLKLVITSTSGFDHLDFKACAGKNIKLAFTPEANAASAAELTWGLVISCARKLQKAHEQVKNEDWNRATVTGHQLEGRTYGVIGLGRVGSRVAKVANAFNMKVIGFDPYLSEDQFRQMNVERVGIGELFRSSQIVSVHVPKTKETEFFISKDFLMELGPEGIFVNTSRGEVIRNDDLLLALESDEIGAIGLDVFETEPPSKELKLIQDPRVVLSPHIGGSTVEALENSSMMAAQTVLDFLDGKSIRDSLPPTQAWYLTPHAR